MLRFANPQVSWLSKNNQDEVASEVKAKDKGKFLQEILNFFRYACTRRPISLQFTNVRLLMDTCLLLLELLISDPGHLAPGRGLHPTEYLGNFLLANLLHHSENAGAEKHLKKK